MKRRIRIWHGAEAYLPQGCDMLSEQSLVPQASLRFLLQPVATPVRRVAEKVGSSLINDGRAKSGMTTKLSVADPWYQRVSPALPSEQVLPNVLAVRVISVNRFGFFRGDCWLHCGWPGAAVVDGE